jgi:hypothetical protein
MSRYQRKTFSENRASGWGMGLYRQRSEGWIAGLCSGLARYWDVPNWVVRLCSRGRLRFGFIYWLGWP